MNTALWIIQGLLALLYAMTGAFKAFQPAKFRETPQMEWASGMEINSIRFIGIMELLGSFGLILPLVTGILPWLTPLAAIGLTLIQVLAIFITHLPRKEYLNIVMNVLLIALQIFIVFGRWDLLV